MTGRKARVPRPAVAEEWDLRFKDKRAADDWDKLCATHAEAAARCHDFLRADPRKRTDRNHPLKGSLALAAMGGKDLEQWQHEVTGAGRVWFLIDDDTRTLWFAEVSLGHPKRTGG